MAKPVCKAATALGSRTAYEIQKDNKLKRVIIAAIEFAFHSARSGTWYHAMSVVFTPQQQSSEHPSFIGSSRGAQAVLLDRCDGSCSDCEKTRLTTKSSSDRGRLVKITEDLPRRRHCGVDQTILIFACLIEPLPPPPLSRAYSFIILLSRCFHLRLGAMPARILYSQRASSSPLKGDTLGVSVAEILRPRQ